MIPRVNKWVTKLSTQDKSGETSVTTHGSKLMLDESILGRHIIIAYHIISDYVARHCWDDSPKLLASISGEVAATAATLFSQEDSGSHHHFFVVKAVQPFMAADGQKGSLCCNCRG